MMHRGPSTRAYGALLCTTILILLTLLGNPATADAQVSCADRPTGLEVSTAADFNAAVACHNAATSGTTNIVLVANIEASTLTSDAVFAAIGGGDLVIVGNGHSLRRAANAPSTALPVLKIDPSSPSLISTIDLAITVTSADTVGIEHSGRSSLRLVSTSIQAASPGLDAVGVTSASESLDGGFSLIASVIEGTTVGLRMQRPDYFIESSTIESTQIDIAAGASDRFGGQGLVENSTLAGPIGIEMDGGGAKVETSTILGDGAAVVDAVGNGKTSFRSSIVNSCSSDLLVPNADPPIQGWIDNGFNVGGCTGGAPLDLTLEDNFCSRRTPVGCPETAAIDASSPARNAGNCGSPDAFRPIEADQRGYIRARTDTTCDAGAFEFGCGLVPAATYLVTTEMEFNAAISCHNLGFIGSTIELQNDIAATRLAGPEGVFADIGPGPLTILGNNHSLRRAASADTRPRALLALEPIELPGLVPADPVGLGAAGGGAGGGNALSLIELGLELGPYETAGFLQDGFGEPRFTAISIYPGPDGSDATGISIRTDEPFFVMSSSTIVGLPVGIEISASTALIENSTIESTDVDLEALGGYTTVVAKSTLAGPIGIRVGNSGVTAVNSTILGDGAALSEQVGPNTFVAFESSIINSCTATKFETGTEPGPGWGDLGNNVGGCVDGRGPVTLQLGDNGCEIATPTGCARTAAIGAGSVARNAGSCDDTRFGQSNLNDQRGAPRTPPGERCDAGAFEFASCEGQTSTTVTVETVLELDGAIDCFNAGLLGAGEYLIELGDDITFSGRGADTQAMALSVDQPSQAHSLVIDGSSHSLLAPDFAAVQAALPDATSLFAMAPTNAAQVELVDIELGSTDGNLSTKQFVVNESSAPLILERAALNTSETPALFLDRIIWSTGAGDLTLRDSIINASSVLEMGANSTLVIDNSTLISPEPGRSDRVEVVAQGASVQITNSTFDGVTLLGSPSGTIASSTFNGDTPFIGGPTATIRSSVVTGSCGAPLVDGGSNIGDCFGTSITLPTAQDNRCATATPAGCPPTIRIDAESPARNAGDCTGVPADQRGEPRTPNGPGCDAGAFEFVPCTGRTTQIVTVISLSGLNSAIECFNQGSFGPGLYRIDVSRDIDFTGPGASAEAMAVSVDQPAPGFSLLIDGLGNFLRAPDRAALAASNPQSESLFAITASNRAPVEFRDVAFSVPEDEARIKQLVRNSSPATLTLQTVGFTGRQFELDQAIWSSGPGTVEILDSRVRVGNVGVRTGANSALVVENSSFEVTGVAVAGLDPNAARAAGGGPNWAVAIGAGGTIDILNSTFSSTEIAGDPAGTVRNSTFAGFGTFVGSPAVTVTSSIVEDCGAFLIDGGNNHGHCFEPFLLIPPLPFAADNGCAVETPIGCPKTVRVDEILPALGEGDCTDVPTDQRGEPRTPAGPGCDIGSFEGPPPLQGDVDADGDVDTQDVRKLLVWLAGGQEPPALSAGDVTGDGQVKLDDALAIAQGLTG